MREYPELSLKCIKGQPINDISFRNGISCGCVEAEILLDKFIHILLNPAYAIFYGLTGRYLGMKKCIDIFDSVKNAYSKVAYVQRGRTWRENDLGHIE